MNVLLVVPSYPSKKNPYGGIFVHEQIKAMYRIEPNMNIEVIKIDPYVPKIISRYISKYSKHENTNSSYVYEGIKVNTIKVLTFPRNLFIPFRSRITAIKLNRYLNRQNKKFDIIHSHGAVHTGYAVVKNSKYNNYLSVVTAHGSDIMYYPNLSITMRNMINFTLSNANAVVAVSKALKNAINNGNELIPVEVIYTGINLNKFAMEQTKKIDSKKNKFIFIGNMLHTKGVHELIKAYEILQNKGINCELSFCGEGKERESIIKYCKIKKIDNVKFHGAVNNDDVPHILSKNEILVLPSYSEGLATVILEALAMGKLVVATNVGGIPEVIKDNKNGFLCKPMNVEELAITMEKAIKKLPKFKPEELRRTIEKDFDIDSNALLLINKYKELINKSME